MQTKNSTATRQMTLTRLINAPIELVWEAWTDPKQVAQWWGPNGFSSPVCQWDAKPGNTIHIDMQGPDGTIYPMGGEFIELQKPTKLVFIAAALDSTGKQLFENLNTVTFTDKGGKTEINIHVSVSDVKPGAEEYLKGMNEGWNQTIDKMGDFVLQQGRVIVFEKEYNAPIAVVWKAITDKDQMKEWYFDIAEFKPEVGFKFQFYGQGREGQKYLHLCEVKEVVPGKKLSYSWRYDKYPGNSLVSF